MIINLLINLILLIFGSLFVFLPQVSLSSIPYIGDDLVSILTNVVLTWNAFMATFPYAQTGWHILLYVIFPFEILLLVSKFFLGHRTPSNHIN